MLRQIVWYPDGSPAGEAARALPAGFEAHPLSRADEVRRRSDDPEAVVLDLDGDGPDMVESLGGKLSGLPIVAFVSASAAPERWPDSCYAYLSKPVTPFILARTLERAFEHARLTREAEQTKNQLEELNQIGVRLSAERDADALLAMILTKAREVTHSDAGSIYLVEEPAEGRRLRFKLTQNDFVSVPFTEFTIPISEESVAGHVALSGEVLHLEDAYAPPAGAAYRINRSFDQQAGYRTKSMLVVPMKTPAGETIGVLQLINCKRHGNRRFPSAEAIEREAIPYPERFMSLAASLASQAGGGAPEQPAAREHPDALRGLRERVGHRDRVARPHHLGPLVPRRRPHRRSRHRRRPRRSPSLRRRPVHARRDEARSATRRCSTTSARWACARRCWSRPRSSSRTSWRWSSSGWR